MTPLPAEPVEDGFVIKLVYGEDTDWCRNLLAAGKGTLDLKGEAVRILNPKVVDLSTVQDQLRAARSGAGRGSGFGTACASIARSLGAVRPGR